MDYRVVVPLLLFLFGVLLGAIKWLLQRHEGHIVGAIERLESRMQEFERGRVKDQERFHKIELEIQKQHSVFVPRAEFGTFCMLTRQGGRRAGDPPADVC